MSVVGLTGQLVTRQSQARKTAVQRTSDSSSLAERVARTYRPSRFKFNPAKPIHLVNGSSPGHAPKEGEYPILSIVAVIITSAADRRPSLAPLPGNRISWQTDKVEVFGEQ